MHSCSYLLAKMFLQLLHPRNMLLGFNHMLFAEADVLHISLPIPFGNPWGVDGSSLLFPIVQPIVFVIVCVDEEFQDLGGGMERVGATTL